MRLKNQKIAFSYYGSKYTHLHWLLPLLAAAKTRAYHEPCGGSASVLINREPSEIETLGDVHGEVVNFFRVLREHKQRLIELIELTPYSRAEYDLARNPDRRCVTEIERARRFYIVARMTRNSVKPAASRWAFSRNTVRRGISKSVSAWLHGPDDLSEIADRLKHVHIECLPAVDAIKLHDGPDVLHYIDPPYPHESRVNVNSCYEYEMNNEQQRELAHTLHNVKGKVAISGYDCPLMWELYSDFYCIVGPRKVAAASKIREKRMEMLWTNYDVAQKEVRRDGRREKKRESEGTRRPQSLAA